MKSLSSWILVGGLVLAGACGDDDGDSPVAVDSGVSNVGASDAGASELGKVVDAGASGLDASLSIDAGPTPITPSAQVDASAPVDAASSLVADAGLFDAAQADASTIEVAGHFRSNFDADEDIDNTRWSFTKLVEFDNEKNFAITQNAANDMFGPSQFNRYVWTPISNVDGSFFYCTVDYGLATLEDARASTKTADASDPLNGGCGGFGWTKLSPIRADAGL